MHLLNTAASRPLSAISFSTSMDLMNAAGSLGVGCKRLAASFALPRFERTSDGNGRDAAVAATRSCRERLPGYAHMSPLEVWYLRITARMWSVS